MASFLNERRGVPRWGKRLFLLGAFFGLTTFVAPLPPPARGPRAEGSLQAVPVRLDEDDAARARVGALVFRRGWSLASDAPRFGGISAIHVEDGAVTAVSDAGDLFLFSLPGSEGPEGVRIRALPTAYGSPARKGNRDIEAMSVRGDAAWLVFERNHAIARYDRGTWQLEAAAQPETMRRWPRNAGAEAVVRLPDGRFLVIAEGGNSGATSAAVLFDGDPAQPGTDAVSGRYRRPAGYRATDAALLPDGRLLILNRRAGLWAGISAKLVIADLPAAREGFAIEGREVASLASPLTIDNMEALSVAQEGGRTIVRIASDNNFMRIQRTLLLEFELDEESARRRPPR